MPIHDLFDPQPNQEKGMKKLIMRKRINLSIYRMIRNTDIDSVLILMDELKPNIGGSRDPSLYRAFCQEALLDKRVIFLVCEEESQIIGFYLAIIDRNHWRMSFIYRHPWLLAKMICTRVFINLQKLLRTEEHKTNNIEHNTQEISMYITPTTPGRSWGESSPQIAKLMFIGVGKSHRRKQVANGLLSYMIDTLAERGIRRADMIILLHNIPSIRLVHPFGFKLYRQGSHLFGTKDIG